jgi:adenosylmethionine-8-amino-7-oxononanoate aminotransferase
LAQLRRLPLVQRTRVLGGIAAFNLGADPERYDAAIGRALQQRCLEAGLIVRPLGNAVYLLPPYCLSAPALTQVYEVLYGLLEKLSPSTERAHHLF